MKCKFCGAELPENAGFCPVCNRGLIEKKEVKVPAPRKKKLLALCALALVVAVAACAVFLRPEAKEETPADSWTEGLLSSSFIKNKEGIGDTTYDVGYDHYIAALTCDGTGLANKKVNVKVAAHFFAQTLNMNIHGAGISHKIITPHLFQQHLT